ncbi:hypothetical protein ACHHYP_14987 [Achlya hypogyna]|uniref:Uncharacterized protein n=1 Tax=Achlya hypogyna TaxID=1202772 RepID=A0A1V9YBR3_ACHHY|nr:hypothetical protein ACHHYP_14987 [Achlya hypogyna]
MVQLLLEAGADACVKNHKGKTARDIAKVSNKTYVLRAFDEALARAAISGDITRMRNLLATGVDANTTNYSGDTPLLVAVTQGHAAIVELLLEAGADPFQTTTDGSLLLVAQRHGHDAVVAVLEKPFKTVLFSAVVKGNTTEVTSMLTQGLSPNCIDEMSGQTLMQVAVAGGHTNVVARLMEAGGNFTQTTSVTLRSVAATAGTVILPVAGDTSLSSPY